MISKIRHECVSVRSVPLLLYPMNNVTLPSKQITISIVCHTGARHPMSVVSVRNASLYFVQVVVQLKFVDCIGVSLFGVRAIGNG